MIVASGNVTMDLDLNRLNGVRSETQESKLDTLRFEVGRNSFFTILVFNNVLRGPEPGSMGLIRGNSAILPEPLNASLNQLVIEKLHSDASFDLVVRDGKTGFVFFNIEGNLYDYDAAAHLLSIKGGRLLISEEFAKKLGRPADAGVDRRGNFDRDDHVSDRNHDGRQRRRSIVDPATPGRRGSECSGSASCRDLMSSLEICPPGSNLEVAELRSVWGWERPLAITATSSSIGFRCPSTIIRSFRKISIG